ncbi:asialoglycoprotein receptor 2-like isoform X4 [Melanotaenia boesemani]|uniref:asialoglycoprotein receptor 2-like isoform X4 n=1 Tax=Melanotaenia boesemani TaxID=1250792 RepID=UPI001C0502AA|nr:asialoglycoprotein receptor 2-like isoform X4 [Melanotaenia boesemani]
MEEEINYASVVFKPKGPRPEAKNKEEVVYEEVKLHSEPAEKHSDINGMLCKAGPLPDKESEKRSCFKKLAYCFGIACVILSLGVGGLFVYNEIRNLMTEKMDLIDQKKNLETKIQTLETEKKNLTEQIQNLEAEMIQFNTSRAQWSINAYCRQQDSPRTCKPCESGWLHNRSSCYAVNNPDSAGQKNWEEARKDCSGKGSDLVVVADDIEKKNISGNSWGSSGFGGYWIGLRAKDGKWKWVDGSDLAYTSWMTELATDGRCVISVQHEGWKSVSCDVKQRWICEKAALSV